jgi:hypothetical protein
LRKPGLGCALLSVAHVGKGSVSGPVLICESNTSEPRHRESCCLDEEQRFRLTALSLRAAACPDYLLPSKSRRSGLPTNISSGFLRRAGAHILEAIRADYADRKRRLGCDRVQDPHLLAAHGSFL